MDVLFNKGQAMMSQEIESHLDNLPINKDDLNIPIPVLTNYLAGSFLILLKWWVEHKHGLCTGTDECDVSAAGDAWDA